MKEGYYSFIHNSMSQLGSQQADTYISNINTAIDALNEDILGLQSILTDKKTRGIFGEVNLNYILNSVFGENNLNIYDVQHKMSNGYIADSILYAPEPLGTICIDSKFPLENIFSLKNTVAVGGFLSLNTAVSFFDKSKFKQIADSSIDRFSVDAAFFGYQSA